MRSRVERERGRRPERERERKRRARETRLARAASRERGASESRSSLERDREFEFYNPLLQYYSNTVKLQYSFIRKQTNSQMYKNQITFNNRTQRLIVTPNFLKGNKIIHMFIVFKINQYSCLHHVQEQGN